MRFLNITMSRLIFSLLIICLCHTAAAQSNSSTLPLKLMPNKSFADVQTQAAFDTINGPVFSNSPTTLPYHTTLTGSVTADSTMTQLSIQSDDGCNVYVDGVLEWSSLDKPQALPDISSSLHELPITLTPGQTYDIRIDYSNIIYTQPDPTTGKPLDIDGCTLFMYGSEQKEYFLYIDNNQDSILAGDSTSSLAQTSVTAYIEDQDGNPVPGIKINFSSVYEDDNGDPVLVNGKPESAGTIGAVYSADHVTTDANGQAQVTLTASNMTGTALVTASADLPDNTSQSDEADISFDAPVAEFDYSPDGWEPIDNGWELGTTITVTFDGVPVPDLPLNLLSPVYNNSQLVPNSASWASFDNVSPTTDNNGQCQLELLWTPGDLADPSAQYIIMSECDDPGIAN